jgi:hypothetical protein
MTSLYLHFVDAEALTTWKLISHGRHITTVQIMRPHGLAIGRLGTWHSDGLISVVSDEPEPTDHGNWYTAYETSATRRVFNGL